MGYNLLPNPLMELSAEVNSLREVGLRVSVFPDGQCSNNGNLIKVINRASHLGSHSLFNIIMEVNPITSAIFYYLEASHRFQLRLKGKRLHESTDARNGDLRGTLEVYLPCVRIKSTKTKGLAKYLTLKQPFVSRESVN